MLEQIGLTIAFWLHMAATIVWIGGLFYQAVVVNPALERFPDQRGRLANDLRRRFPAAGLVEPICTHWDRVATDVRESKLCRVICHFQPLVTVYPGKARCDRDNGAGGRLPDLGAEPSPVPSGIEAGSSRLR